MLLEAEHLTVNAIPGAHPNAPGSNVLQMYWKLTNGGLTSADVTFNYLDADVVGDENKYELGRYNGISGYSKSGDRKYNNKSSNNIQE